MLSTNLFLLLFSVKVRKYSAHKWLLLEMAVRKHSAHEWLLLEMAVR
jgi:hypothetical protein